jgi:hypothetical protein
VLEGLREHFGFIDQSLNPDLKDIQVSFIASGHNFFVADHNGQIVGTVGLLYESGRAGPGPNCKDVCAQGTPEEWNVLLATCIEVAKAEGFAEVVAFTEPHWLDAVGFYTARGFRQYDRDEIDIHLRLPL